MTVDLRTVQAALAGLLHDIGKFAQRAGDQVSAEWTEGKTRQDFKYQHALHTWHFVNRYLPKTLRQAGIWAAYHHRPPADGRFLQLADRLAAGERREDEAQEDDADQARRHPQLLSIFCSAELDAEAPEKRYLPLNPLRMEQQVLEPGPPRPEAEVQQAYADLWQAFCHQMEDLGRAFGDDGDPQAYLETLQGLLLRYTWCIPSAYYQATPDVSLYDHGRMTGALAAVLVDADLPEATWERLLQEPAAVDEELALLVGGDLSGVQDFLYTITNKGATSALRGRSFYLQLLTEALARHVLRALGLPVTCLIYAGGGNFFLFARPSDRERLEGLRRDLSALLYDHHRGDLYLALEAEPLRAADFFRASGEQGPHPFGQKWADLGRRLARAKLRRFAELPEDRLKALFKPEGTGGQEQEDGACQVCGQEHPVVIKERVGQEKVRKCGLCRSFETLGKDLRAARFLAFRFVEPAPPAGGRAGSWQEVLRHLGLEVSLSEKAPGTGHSLVLALDDRGLGEVGFSGRTALARRYLVNITPRLEKPYQATDGQAFEMGDIKPFERLAKDSSGIERLGVLRMDMDNLGRLFAEGLRDATPSRLATLSLAISLYFEGWVGELARLRNEQTGDGGRLYAIYSGGDDLFFVGAWDEVVELARQIRADLRWYAAGHPDVHASAGLVLVDSKYPLARAAQAAADAEDRAKTRLWWKGGRPYRKDAVAFLGQALPWERFGLEDCAPVGLDTAHALMHTLRDMVERGQAERSLLRLLIDLYGRYAEAERARAESQTADSPPRPLWGPWHWLAAYYLRRRLKTNDAEARVGGLRDQMVADPLAMETIGLAARWAELATRARET